MSAFDLPLNNPYHAVLYAPSPQPSTSSPTLPRGHATDAPGRLAQHLPPPVSSHSSSSPPSSTMSSAAGSSSSSREDLVLTTPPAVVRFLILSAPFAAAFRRALEVVLWRGKKHARSWSVVVGWWAVCLIGWGIVRYLLPPLLLALVLHPHLPPLPLLLSLAATTTTVTPSPATVSSANSCTTPSSEPATSKSLVSTLADYSSINAMLHPARPDWLRDEDWDRKRILRALAGVWVVWIVGGWLFGVRVMLGLLGSAILLFPSPYVHPLLVATESSHLLNQTLFCLSVLVLGPSPSHAVPPTLSTSELLSWAWKSAAAPVVSHASKVAGRGRSGSIKSLLGIKSSVDINKAHATGAAPAEQEKMEWEEEPVRFRFEVLENQRWWLGLDWTSTLAPGDHPVWCDTHLNPTPAPPAFPLPPSSRVSLPSSSHPGWIEERTAFWRWIEDDWSVLRNVEGQGVTGRTPFVPSKLGVQQADASGASPLPTNGDGGVASNPTGSSSASSSMAGGIAGFQARISLGEQALSKGLERLKAVTAPGSPSSPGGANGGPTSPTKTGGAGVGGGLSSSGSFGSGGNEARTLYAMSLPEGGGGSSSGGLGGGAGSGAGGEEHGGVGAEVEDLDAKTDEGGWSYGGNKWEGMSAKGGLGKFTRRRRWARQAICTESVRLIPDPQQQIQNQQHLRRTSASSPADLLVREKSLSPSPTIATTTRPAEVAPAGTAPALVGGGGGGGTGGSEPGGMLRMRLKKAVEGGR